MKTIAQLKQQLDDIQKQIKSLEAKSFIIKRELHFEVYPTDAPKLMTHVEAEEYAKSIGDGWRLPTLEELRLMYDNCDQIGGFVTKFGSGIARWYLTCTGYRDGAAKVFIVDFSVGQDCWGFRDLTRTSSRLVRSVNHSSI